MSNRGKLKSTNTYKTLKLLIEKKAGEIVTGLCTKYKKIDLHYDK